MIGRNRRAIYVPHAAAIRDQGSGVRGQGSATVTHEYARARQCPPRSSSACLPVPDGFVDAIVSVFGVIFAPDAMAAAAEIARVIKPGGRITLSAWLRQGALADQARMRAELVASVYDKAPGSALFAWHDPEVLRGLLAPYGFSVAIHDHALAFTGASPEEYADHPGWVEARELLPSGRWEHVRADLIQLFADANEDPERLPHHQPLRGRDRDGVTVCRLRGD
jgi:SAM-dependent methyltransferase